MSALAAPPAPPRAERVWTPGAIALVAAGALLRGWDLGRQSYWHDEIHSLLNTLTPRGIELGSTVMGTVFNTHGPLFLLLLAAWTRLAGDGEAAARALPALLGTAGLVAFHPLATRMVGGRAARVALALLAFSPFHLWYSQELRGYTLMFLTALLALRAFRADAERRTPRSFALALAATVAACLSNLAGCFLLPVFAAWAAPGRHRVAYPARRLLVLGALSALLLSPWIVVGLGSTGRPHLRGTGDGEPVPIAKGEAPPGALAVPFTFFDFTVGHSFGPTVDELKRERLRAVRPYLPSLLAVAGLFALATALGLRAVDAARRRALLLWVLPPVLLMASLSAFNLKAPNSRYAFLAFPAYLMLIGAGVASLRPAAWRAALLGALLACFAASDVAFYTAPRYWKPDMRSAGRLLGAEARPGDAIVAYALDYPLYFYAARAPMWTVPPPSAFASDQAAARWLDAHTHPGQRVWTVQCQSWWVDRDDRFVRVAAGRLTPDGAWDFPKVPVRRFVRPAGGDAGR